MIVNGIDKLPGLVGKAAKVFMVVDSSYPFLNIKDAIEALQVEKVMFSGFTPNPLYEQVCDGIDLFRASGCDTIVAVGGGSAIDVAKCIKLAVLAKEGPSALIPPLVSQRLPIDGSRIPFIAIPTTAGTGSESTHNAVMYYQGAKQTVTNDGVLPDFALLEPSVLKTLPLYQKKSTMMDALCQGIESWWSVNSTPESKEYSRKAVELIMGAWRQYIFDNDSQAAAQIMLAANYGGRAINIAQTTAPHAMSYKITSMYGLPHGHAVAVCLPEVWQYMLDNPSECADPRGREYLNGIFGEIARALCPGSVFGPFLTPGSEKQLPGSSFGPILTPGPIERFREMMAELELGRPNAANGDIDTLTASVNPVRLKNNPVALSEHAIRKIYGHILG